MLFAGFDTDGEETGQEGRTGREEAPSQEKDETHPPKQEDEGRAVLS